MRILKLYEGLITEKVLTSCIQNFGYELFGQELNGNEPNTKLEDEYITLIKQFTGIFHGKSVQPDFIQAINKLKGCMSQYPDVLVPNNIPVYRGKVVPISYFINNHKAIYSDKPMPMPYVYKAQSQVQSWSISPKNAAKFGSNGQLSALAKVYVDKLKRKPDEADNMINQIIDDGGLTIACIIKHAASADDFIFKAKYLNKLSYHKDEDEVIRISNTPTQMLLRFNDDPETGITSDGLILLKAISNKIIGG